MKRPAAKAGGDDVAMKTTAAKADGDDVNGDDVAMKRLAAKADGDDVKEKDDLLDAELSNPKVSGPTKEDNPRIQILADAKMQDGS